MLAWTNGRCIEKRANWQQTDGSSNKGRRAGQIGKSHSGKAAQPSATIQNPCYLTSCHLHVPIVSWVSHCLPFLELARKWPLAPDEMYDDTRRRAAPGRSDEVKLFVGGIPHAFHDVDLKEGARLKLEWEPGAVWRAKMVASHFCSQSQAITSVSGGSRASGTLFLRPGQSPNQCCLRSFPEVWRN